MLIYAAPPKFSQFPDFSLEKRTTNKIQKFPSLQIPTYSPFLPSHKTHVPRVDVSERKVSVHPKKHFQEMIFTSHWKLISFRSQISRNSLCFFQPISTKFKKTKRKTPRIPYHYQHSKRMPTEGGNKPRNIHPAHQVLSTLHTDPCGYSPFPQEIHHSSSVPEHSTN